MQPHSARVDLWLSRGDTIVPLHQVSYDGVVALRPVDLPPGRATLHISVDGEVATYAIDLPDGMKAADQETRINLCDPISPHPPARAPPARLHRPPTDGERF
jgi:hypothetical protein